MSSIHLNSVIRLLKLKGNDDYSLVTYTNTVSATDPTDIIQVETLDPIYSFEGKFKNSEIDGNTIKIGDIKFYVDPSTCLTEPTTADKITDGTNYYTIVDVHKYRDQDTVALYIFQLRK